MASDVARFALALDKVYKTCSTQEVQLDKAEMRGLGERDSAKYIEKKFQEQLQRARGAFLHEFRNHSVVVENEVRKIRVELTEKFEEKYGEKISSLNEQLAEASVSSQKQREEITHLKSLVIAQESYLTAVRHHWGMEQRDKLKSDLQSTTEALDGARTQVKDLTWELECRDDLVTQLQGELSALEENLSREAGNFVEEKRGYDEKIRSLKLELSKQQDHYKEQVKQYDEKFAEYRAKTAAELQIQEILNHRRSEALALMEEERQRHIKARMKQTRRIGDAGEDSDADGGTAINYQDYTLSSVPYRVDHMGMDTSWRDYQLQDVQLVPPARQHKLPKFNVVRADRLAKSANLGPSAPVPTDTPRQVAVRPQTLSLPPTGGRAGVSDG